MCQYPNILAFYKELIFLFGLSNKLVTSICFGPSVLSALDRETTDKTLVWEEKDELSKEKKTEQYYI